MKPLLEQTLFQAIVADLQAQSRLSVTEVEVRELAFQHWKSMDRLLPLEDQKKLMDAVVFAIIGLGPLEFLLRDESVSEIMVNGPDTIYVERSGKLERTDLSFIDEAQLISVINTIVGRVGKRIDERTPLVDARLTDGSRVNAIIAPLSVSGSVLTIRKFPSQSFGIEQMLAYDSLTLEMADFLKSCVESRHNILVSGGTGAGKTSTLNACASLIPQGERIITIEDVAEIRIDHPHLVRLESRSANVEGEGEIPIRTLLKNALRMRPDRIVVGEIRGGEALDMLQAMNTGHKGSLTTVHANAPLESLFRVETMGLMAPEELPLSALRPQVSQAIDLIIQQERLPGGARKIVSIAEVNKESKEGYDVNILFEYDKHKEVFTAPNKSKHLIFTPHE